MVSLQASTVLSVEEKKLCSITEKPSIKKRKRDDSEADALQLKETKHWKTQLPKLDSPIELNLDTAPLPLEWQRCLDIKSGEIHFYNTRTQRRTFKDPRWSPETNYRPGPTMNLELNLMCEPSETHGLDEQKAKDDAENSIMAPALVPADGADELEMVAAVCVRCHMLVMMCKALPSCPNCKFEHPPGSQSKATLRLWCRGDR